MNFTLQNITGAFLISLIMVITLMLIGSYNSLHVQLDLINTYQMDMASLSATGESSQPRLDFIRHNYRQTVLTYNASLQRFPASIVAKIYHFPVKSPD